MHSFHSFQGSPSRIPSRIFSLHRPSDWPALSNLGQPCKVVFPLHLTLQSKSSPFRPQPIPRLLQTCPQEQVFHVSPLNCVSGHRALPLLQQCRQDNEPKNVTDSKIQPFKDLTTFNAHRLNPPSVSQIGLSLGVLACLHILEQGALPPIKETHLVSEKEGHFPLF